MKTLQHRKEVFTNKVIELGEPYERTKAFIEYWTEHNDGGRKMRFEMAKNQPFNIGRRMGTWKRNEARFGGDKKQMQRDFLKQRYGNR